MDRSQKIMEEIHLESKDLFNEFHSTADKFKSLYETTMGKLDNIIKSNCGHIITWLEQNSDFSDQGPAPKDKSKTEEFDKNIKEIEVCIRKNDHGISDTLMEFENKVRLHDASLNDNMRKCFGNKSDEEAKKCAKNLLGDTFKNIISLYKDEYQKIEDISKRI